jgi:16S rRNA (cytosine967-C5)-methyltransferase
MSRIAAWEVLRSGSGTPMRDVDAAARRHALEPRDRGLLRRIIGTEVRRRGTLRALVRKLARGKPKADIVAHLHVGLVQLFFLDRVPDHAAVSETCDAVRRTLGQSKVGYVNGVLRAALRMRREGSCGDPQRDLVGRELHLEEPTFRHPEQHPLLWMEDALSLPAAIARRWTKRFGAEETARLARAFLDDVPLSVRVVSGEPEALRAELAALEPAPGSEPELMVFASDRTDEVLASLAFSEGRITVQGGAAYRAARALGAKEGERVLDMCAAPGGKTAVLAATGAQVLATDVSDERLERVRDTLDRLGLEERVELRASNGTSAVDERDFDAALIDAPCSNTGVLGARPGARWRFGPKELASLRELQEGLLREGLAVLRPGGRLVWSTCSLEPEENEQLVRRVAGDLGDVRVEDVVIELPDLAAGRTDGGGRALLVKEG